MKHFVITLLSLLAGFFVDGIAYAQNWKLTSAPAANWAAVAVSSDGGRMFAAIQGGGIYRSTNAGVTWLLTSAPTTNQWRGLATSVDGTKVAAAAFGGRIFTSTDAGANWQQTTAPSLNWTGLASSTNGAKLFAVASIGRIYASSNGGTNWTTIATLATNWSSIACSGDGTRLVASYYGDGIFVIAGGIYVSANSGATWTPSGSPNISYTDVASSVDGKRLIAIGAPPSGFGGPGASQIYLSTNSGANWTQNTTVGILPNAFISSVASSANGAGLAFTYEGSFFGPVRGVRTSLDGGATWTENTPNVPFNCVATSADASQILAGTSGGGLYTWQYQPKLQAVFSRTNVALAWKSSPLAAGFQLQQKSDLWTTNWTKVDGSVSDDGTNMTINLSPAASNLFFRLKK